MVSWAYGHRKVPQCPRGASSTDRFSLEKPKVGNSLHHSAVTDTKPTGHDLTLRFWGHLGDLRLPDHERLFAGAVLSTRSRLVS